MIPRGTVPTLIEFDREIARRSFAEFCKMAWNVLEPATPLKWGWCLDAICEHLQAVHDGRIKRLLMNVPPGCMKSLTTSVFFPAWEWGPGGRPDLRYISTSHADRLATRDNLKCRRLIQSEWYQERWPIILTGDQNQKTKFENTSMGFRESMPFTSMTGSRGDRVIIDDPLSVDDANSQAAIDSAKSTFLEAVPTRVNDDRSAIIVIMQRLHTEDVSGVILSEGLPYDHLMLPMRFDPGRRCSTSIGFTDPRTKDGELLFPERFTEQTVAELEKTMGSYASAGQFQQSPVPRGGALIKTEWLNRWHSGDCPEYFDNVIQSWDMTFKGTSHSDYVVGQVWGTRGANFYLLDQVRGQWDFVQTLQAVRMLTERWPQAYTKLVEEKANGAAVISQLKDQIGGFVPITPKESKAARAFAVTPIFEAGNVFIPPSAVAWVDRDYVPELMMFPAGAHDDQVDATTQALSYLKDYGGGYRMAVD